MPVFMKRRWMSFSRHGILLRKYWPSPERKTRRVTVTSLYSRPRTFSQSEKVMLTSAMPSGLRVSVPTKMQSSIFDPRRALALVSPRTQRMASARLLLPQPLGPTIAVMPGSNCSWMGSAKLLKPINSMRLRYTECPFRCRARRALYHPAKTASMTIIPGEIIRRAVAGRRSTPGDCRRSGRRAPPGRCASTPGHPAARPPSARVSTVHLSSRHCRR